MYTDYFRKSLWQRLFDNPNFVERETIVLPREMTGQEIMNAGEKLRNRWSVDLLPYNNGLSIIGEIDRRKIRFSIDLADSPNGRPGEFQYRCLVGDYGEIPTFVPCGPRPAWNHLQATFFREISIIFFEQCWGGSEKRVCYKIPEEIISALFGKIAQPRPSLAR